jgi:hypothetical protein
MTRTRFRTLVLSLDGVTESPHMDRTAFRTKRKIFATLGDDRRVNLIVQPEERRDALIASFPETFASLGGWSRLGYISVDLASADDAILRELVEDAWRGALPVPRSPRRKR